MPDDDGHGALAEGPSEDLPWVNDAGCGCTEPNELDKFDGITAIQADDPEMLLIAAEGIFLLHEPAQLCRDRGVV